LKYMVNARIQLILPLSHPKHSRDAQKGIKMGVFIQKYGIQKILGKDYFIFFHIPLLSYPAYHQSFLK
jgi:hypothetical protein